MGKKKPSNHKKAEQPHPTSIEKNVVKAEKGGVAIAGNVSSSTITTGNQNIINPQITKKEELLENIYIIIDDHPELDAIAKDDLKTDVQEIQKEDVKGGDVDETFIARRLRNIQRMAPDILDVVLATIGNPTAGFSMITKKVADRMKADTENLKS
jgi:translation elongation factor EF-1alpha